jgi:two-component system response regulator YesN
MLSPSYFLHLFKQASGATFTDYLTRTRIDKAKSLLLGSNFNITEIAYKVGYSDSNYFSTVFKNSEGMTPSAYRKQCNRPH